MKNRIHFANIAAGADCLFLNESVVGDDGWAQLAPFGDHPGKAIVTGPDGTSTRVDAIQRIDRATAEAMVKKFKSPLSKVKRYLQGCPIFSGHPDVPALANEHPDKSAKGVIQDLEVRDTGLYCKPVFTNEGVDLLSSKKRFGLSGYWTAEQNGDETKDGKPVYRPGILKSAGLTPFPNLPVDWVNTFANSTYPQNSPPDRAAELQGDKDADGVLGTRIDNGQFTNADGASDRALDLTKTARAAGRAAKASQAGPDYALAFQAHTKAMDAHTLAADLHDKSGNTDDAAYHTAQAAGHETAAGAAFRKARKLGEQFAVGQANEKRIADLSNDDQPFAVPSGADAQKASKVASAASEKANDAEGLADDHEKAATAHREAAVLHRAVSDDLHQKSTADFPKVDTAKKSQAHFHGSVASAHSEQAWFHDRAAATLKGSEPKALANAKETQATMETTIVNGDYPGHPFHGNQYADGGGETEASKASGSAHEASKSAGITGKASAHIHAAAEHKKAAAANEKEGNTDTAAYHRVMAKWHSDKAGKAKASSANSNEPNTDMNKALIIPILALHGITLANTATDAEFETALKSLSKTALDKTTEAATLANERQALSEKVTAQTNVNRQLTDERDTLRTNFANERALHIKNLLDDGVKAGKITAADRAGWEAKLKVEANFANEVEALHKAAKPALKTIAVTSGAGERKLSIANASERRDAVRSLVETEMANTKCDRDTAFARVQAAHPALFEQMTQPAVKPF